MRSGFNVGKLMMSYQVSQIQDYGNIDMQNNLSRSQIKLYQRLLV